MGSTWRCQGGSCSGTDPHLRTHILLHALCGCLSVLPEVAPRDTARIWHSELLVRDPGFSSPPTPNPLFYPKRGSHRLLFIAGLEKHCKPSLIPHSLFDRCGPLSQPSGLYSPLEKLPSVGTAHRMLWELPRPSSMCFSVNYTCFSGGRVLNCSWWPHESGPPCSQQGTPSLNQVAFIFATLCCFEHHHCFSSLCVSFGNFHQVLEVLLNMTRGLSSLLKCLYSPKCLHLFF